MAHKLKYGIVKWKKTQSEYYPESVYSGATG